MKTITILGATGSVGSSTLDLVEREPERFKVLALTANCDAEKLARAAIRTNAKRAVVADEWERQRSRHAGRTAERHRLCQQFLRQFCPGCRNEPDRQYRYLWR